jgi:hypothetical protein
MRHASRWFLAAAMAFGTAAARAEEPHLEIIRGLRAQGDPDLALRYINEQLTGKLSPEMAQIVELEKARTNVEIARSENEEGKRLALFASARAAFESFLKDHPTHDLAPQAGFEIARLIAAQGKEQLNRARRLDGDARAKALKEARPLFTQAAQKLRDAAKQLSDQLKKVGEPTTPEQKSLVRDLNNSYLMAQLEEGIDLYHLGNTYATEAQPKGDDVKTRALTLDQARKSFEKLQNQDTKHPVCWLARAWAARCWFENDDFGKATLAFEELQAERGPGLDEARRVAAYFRILMARKQGQANKDLVVSLQRWLEQYRPYSESAEGCGARYFLADALEGLADAGVKRDPMTGRPTQVTAEAAARLKEAERLLRALTESENDFTDRAANKRMRIILAIAIRETPDRDAAKVTTFENCYLLSLLEVAELNEELKKPEIGDDPEKSKAARRRHYNNVIRAIDRGLTLLRPTDPPKEILDARIMLVYAHLVAGNNHQAAVLGEHLARGMTRVSRGAVPALYSLQAYRNVMLDTKARGDVKEAESRTDTEQVRRMATFMETTWPNDSPTDTARHTLGTLYVSEGDYLKGLETFARVNPTYVSLAHLRNEQGITCFNLQKDAKVPAAVKRQWLQHTISLLESMPDLGTGAEPEIAYAYCFARMQLANLYLQEGKQYPKVEAIGKSVLEQSAKYALGEKAAEVKAMAHSLELIGLYGRTFELVKGNRHTEAAALYMPAVEEMKKGIPEDDASARVRKAMADLLQLALRSSVQEGQIDRAQEMLKLLEKTGGGSSSLVKVLRDVQGQIEDMRKHDPNRLKDTIDKFSSFLEALSKQPNLSREVNIFLAQGFASLDKPVRAVELLSAIAAPAEKTPGDAPKPPADSAAETEKTKYEEVKTKYEQDKAAYDAAWKTYWFKQLSEIRALRQAGRMEANAEQKKKYFQTADKLLDEIIGTPQKQGWAFNSLETRREKIFVLEDQELWGTARAKWLEMMQQFNKFTSPPKDNKEARVRTAFYESRFYLTRVLYNSNLKNKDEGKKKANIRKLADQIVELEKDQRTADFGGESVKKLYQEWLDDEELIRKAYQDAGGKSLVSRPESAAGAQ